MTATAFFAYAVALGTAAVIPGPSVLTLVGSALGSGFRATVPMVTGQVLGNLLYLSFAVLGLVFVAEVFAEVFLAVRLAGAAYLVYLAWRLWTQSITPGGVTARGDRGALASFSSGLAVTLGNPKHVVFYLALLPAVVDIPSVGTGDFVILEAITAVVLCAVLFPYTALASRARRWLRNASALLWANRAAAVALTAAATTIAFHNP